MIRNIQIGMRVKFQPPSSPTFDKTAPVSGIVSYVGLDRITVTVEDGITKEVNFLPSYAVEKLELDSLGPARN